MDVFAEIAVLSKQARPASLTATEEEAVLDLIYVREAAENVVVERQDAVARALAEARSCGGITEKSEADFRSRHEALELELQLIREQIRNLRVLVAA